MARETQRFWLTFDGDGSRKPLIYEMSKKFEVIFNIRNASVTPTIGIIALELEGDREEIKKAVAWFEANGVQVEPVEINTIEG
jgi:ABC-type methionine transport system ATPase subunit